GQVPGVCIQITAFREFVNSKPPELTWLSPEVRYVNDDKGFCGLGVKESKDEMRPTESGINNRDILRELHALEPLHYCRSKPVVRIKRIATACHHDLGVQLIHFLHWMIL